jgi:plastocyanin
MISAMNRRVLLLAAPVLLAIGIAAGAAEPDTVTIKDFAFSPTPLTVKAGTKVTWDNTDEEPHTVVSVDGQTFKSPALDTDDKFSFTFNTPGTYKYFCSVHPRMVGTVVVN